MQDELRCAPRRHSLARRAAFRAVERLAAACGGRRFYAWAHLRRGRFRVRREVVGVPGLAPSLEGFTLVQLSDLHAGPFLAEGDLAAVVEVANELRPDVCALTGDLVTRHWREALRVLPDLARLRARHGSWAVFGNHDYRERREGDIARAFADRGIRFLRNESARLAGDGAAGGDVVLVGLEDLEEGRVVDLAAARAGLAPGDVELVLCHNPGRAERLARPGCAAVLSGHTHGGQVDLPLLRRMGPRHPGDRVELGPTTLIVSSGLGVVGAPLRWRAPAELVQIVLTGTDGPSPRGTGR